MDKQERYRDLVLDRKACDLCSGSLRNASRIDDGRFDGDEIGAYTRWQGNLNAELMIVGQDFASVEVFQDCRGWPGHDVTTNGVLRQFVAHAGINIRLPVYDQPDDRLFCTNAVLCMKEGRMRGPVPAACVRRCGRLFLRPTIELVAPKLVVTLGRAATQAVSEAFDLNPPARLPASPGAILPSRLFNSTWLMPVFHPTASRSREDQRADWQQIGRVLAELTPVAA
jgi:DNA polymerase